MAGKMEMFLLATVALLLHLTVEAGVKVLYGIVWLWAG